MEAAKKPTPRSPNNADQPNDSSPGQASQPKVPGMFSDALSRTTESMVDHLDEIIKAQKNRKRSGQRPRRKPRNGFFDRLNQAGRKTGKFFGNKNASKPTGGLSVPSVPDPASLIPVAVVGVLIAIVWFLLKGKGSGTGSDVLLTGTATVKMPTGINSRQDVIDAFHAIAIKSPAVKGNWWTHSRAAKAIRALMPTKADDLTNLTRVYETARYLPPDAELTEEQLQVARSAIKRYSE